jgi:hypothetical protein
MTIELTILMPCLNEAKTISICVQKAKTYLSRAGIQGEVLVADNGSTDGSQELARAAGARVVAISQRGYGAALIGGIAAARGKYIIMGDADDSYDFEGLTPFVDCLRRGSVLVMGNRFKGGIAPGAMPLLHRYLGTPVISFIGRLFFRLQVGDFNCGLRGFSRAHIMNLDLSSPGMEFASELIVKVALAGYSINEVPTTLKPDGRDRPPHLRSWRDGWRHLKFMLMLSPRWLFLIPGLLCWTFGTAFCLALAAGPIQVGILTLDIHTMLYAGAASVLGLQMVYFSIFTRLLGTLLGPFQPKGYLEKFLRLFSLERGLLVSLTAIVGGAILAIASLLFWRSHGYLATDPQHLMRVAIPAVVLLIEGAETGMASFFIAILNSLRISEKKTADSVTLSAAPLGQGA